MRPPTSLHENRIGGPRNFRPPVQNDFCNTIQRKAITAASQRLPTGYAPEENALSMTVRMGDFTNVPGGFPIEVGGEVIGAVAAGGAKIEQDVEVAKAALAVLTRP